MNSRATYDEICNEIWHFYQSQKARLTDYVSPWLPPPLNRCDSAIQFLFVGLSPKRLKRYSYAATMEEAKTQTERYKYVSAGGRNDIHFNYDTYYKPLLKIATDLNSDFGVWHQVKAGAKKLLVEFTDFCHLPTASHIALQASIENNPEIRSHCRKIMERELKFYKPQIVVANGVDTSIDLWEMHHGRKFSTDNLKPVITSFLGIENCNVHLSGFIAGARGIDRFNKARLLNEIRQHAKL
jgi:hypothetical protein